MTTTTINTYIKSSEVDYLSHFGQAWIGFNAWYNIHGSGSSEWQRIKSASVNSPLSKTFTDEFDSLKYIDPFVTKEVDSLSTCKCQGANNNTYTYHIDTTGFKFRLQCTNNNEFTKFLFACSNIKALKPCCEGLFFFKPTNTKDPLFKSLYLKYHSHMASPTQMVNPFNASDITSELYSIGIEHYGELLFHNLTQKSSSSIYSLEEALGKKYFKLCEDVKKIRSISKAKQAGLEKQYRAKGLNIFERYLFVLYSFRSAYFHGDINPNNKTAQIAASHALNSLKILMGGIK